MDNSKEIIRQQLALLKQEINDAEKQSGRPQGCVKLQAVSKFHPVQSVLDAISCGQILFGENRVQEYLSKKDSTLQLFVLILFPDNQTHPL